MWGHSVTGEEGAFEYQANSLVSRVNSTQRARYILLPKILESLILCDEKHL
jgi:hypothetical protein